MWANPSWWGKEVTQQYSKRAPYSVLGLTLVFQCPGVRVP